MKKIFRTVCKLAIFTVFLSLDTGVYAASAVKADLSYDGKTAFFLVRLTDGFAKPSHFMMQNPNRIVIDVPDLEWKVKKDFLAAGPVSDIRFGKRQNGEGRIVLELRAPAQVKSLAIIPHPTEIGYGLLRAEIVSEQKFPTANRVGRSHAQTKKPFSVVGLQSYLPKVPAKRSGECLFVIDPGHGGKDSGAVTPSGLYEKNLVLQFSKELSRALNQKQDIRTVLTREADVFIPLEVRPKIADRLKADLFISVHADSIESHPDIQGVTLYTISKDASDKEAEALAAQENLSDTVAGVIYEPEAAPVKHLLIDLAQRETNRYSSSVAVHMVNSLRKVSPMNNKPYRQAGFAVLKSPDTPSILIETGYLTNEADVRRLLDPNARAQKVRAMVDAIMRWRQERPCN